MNAGQNTQQGTSTYDVDIWLPDIEDYPGLSGATPKVQEALGLDPRLPDKPTVVPVGEIEINLRPRFYKQDDKNLDIDGGSVAAISFSEDFAKKYQCHSEEHRVKNGSVAVFAMMGGVLPVEKNFFRMGFSVETIAAIIGDQLVKDQTESHVLLIRVENGLGERFEQVFFRTVTAKSPKWSVDTLKIKEDGTLSELTKTRIINGTLSEPMKKKATNSIAECLSECIPLNDLGRESVHSVVLYGYWHDYWKFAKEVLTSECFRKNNCWLYVESNYPLLAPILDSVRKEGSDKIIVTDSGSNIKTDGQKGSAERKVLVKYGGKEDYTQFTSVLKSDNDEAKNNPNPFDTQGRKKINKGIVETHGELTADDYGRVRCFTGKLVERESSFITFAKETVRLLCAAIRSANDELEKKEDQLEFIRKRICKFLRDSKFYASEHLGAFFFRKDGELFFPIYCYNGKLGRQEIVRESCRKGEESTKEKIADQLLQLSNSLNKIKRAEIPRNLEVCNSYGAKKVFDEFSKMIAEISEGIEIGFVSYYPNTERLFYAWTGKKEESFGKTKQFASLSIFDDVHKNIQGVIQINLKDFDLEDNDAYRVYLVCERAKNVFDALTLAEWWNRQDDVLQSKIIGENEGWESDLMPVKAVVFAQSRIRKQEGQAYEGMSKYEYENIIAEAKYVHYYRDDRESKFNFDEILRGLCQLLECRQNPSDLKSNARFLYYIPEYIPEDNNSSKAKDTGDGQGGIAMTTRCKLSLFDLQIIENMVSRVFSKLKTCLAEHDVLRSNIKSAIGSIMSRNGSHNIGSHVLAALSHNVGTMPDDRVLYQYIQHRMDYIATATTEFPTWKQPTKIVGDVFKTFLSQYHLLNYISGSEGLKAYQFQNPNIDLSTAEQGGTIRIHIRRIDDDDDGWTQSNLFVPGTTGKQPVDFIVYPAGKEMRLDKDVEIAIPGGVIGQHAIYTIIENILRNAAKHEWSNLDKEEKEKCHLDLFVDFKDRPVDGVVEFVVWTCNEKSPTERANGIESDISVSDIYEKLVNEDKGAKLDLVGLLPHQQLQVKVSRPFISSNGQLHKENWGLAEMRISAGFLNTVDIGEIGGVNCTGTNGRQYVEKCLRLIKPVMVQGEIPREQHEKGQRKTIKSSRKAKQDRGEKCYSLGYNFVIPKPKELLVIIPDEIVEVHKERDSCNVRKTLSQADIEAVHKKLRRFGVGVITESELKSPDADITYSYVLAREIAGELQEKGWVCHEEFLKLPFRVLSARGNRPSNQKGTWVGEYTGNLYGSNEGLAKTLMSILSDDFNVEVFAQKLKIEVCRDWLRHIKMQRGFSFSDIPIVIDLYGDSGNSGQSLVTDSDLLKIVFQNCFNAAVKSFFEMWLAEEHVEPINGDEVVRKYIQDAKCVRTVLAILLVMCPRQLEESTGCSKRQGRTRELIQNQLGGWCREARNKIEDGTLANWVSSYYSQRSGDEKDKMPAMLRKVLDELHNAEDATATRNATNCLKVAEQWFAGDDQSINDIPFLGDFIKYLEKTILEQARVFLSKYEERHVTLPCCFAASEYKKEQDTSLYAFSGQEKRKDAQEIEFTSDEDEKIKKGKNAIAYWRHETFKVERSAPPFYLEPLSGAQSYFNSFVQLANEFKNYGDASNARFGHSIVKLVETGLFRVLLIDERVTKFISEHTNVAKTFEHIGVNAIDDNSSATKKLFDRIEPSKIVIDSRGTTISDFEILVIHQGIIDKLLLGHEDPANVKEFIRRIVEEVRYVIITTGRGSPANIPPTARVLPFSIIENTLFRNYPEKMVLVDAVMNVLPDSNTKKKD